MISFSATLVLLFFGQTIAMSDEMEESRAEEIQEIDARASNIPNPANKTMGGRQFWGDLTFCHGWRIQQNVLSGHHRLLDPEDHRVASGSREDCDSALQQVRRDRDLPVMSGKAVLLLHGLGRSSKSFASMAKALREDGYTVVGFDYPSTRLSLPGLVSFLDSTLKSLEGIESIDVVCHSMGGLLVRTFLMEHSEPRFRRMVMLGVPNKGAQIADRLKSNVLFKAVLGPAGQQLVTDRDGFISRLPTPEFEFGVLAGGRSAARGYNPLIPGDNDSTVSVSSTRLPGASDFVLLPVIHSFLMTDVRCIEATRYFLKHGQFIAGRAPSPISSSDISVVE